MEKMDIYTFGQYLSTIKVDNIYETQHFRERMKVRFGEDFIKEVYTKIFDCTPVGILEQFTGKFKVLYRYNEDYDLTIIIGIKKVNPIEFSLVTCFKEASRKRVRADGQDQN
ncbi:hypothetical protein [Methanolobus sp.]|uniref:hypothetical protein n=1 Tax=Methanolobus sp. TaxID=1874737 RepID=UPI0025CF6E39|nr:hypothetical protein [Methanolobus sp.]